MYLCDLYLQGETYKACLNNISDTFKLLRELGFVIHTEKSLLTPSQTVFSLGFIISSKNMRLPLTDEKKNKIFLRELARILGNIIASFPAVYYRYLHYRHLEKEKLTGLKDRRGNFVGKITLSAKPKAEIEWWINNIDNSYCHTNIPNPGIRIY